MHEYSRHDILVELRFGKGEGVDAKLIVEGLDLLETALYNSDRLDVERAAARLRVSSVVRDASLERLRGYRHHRIQLVEAQSGSIILLGAIVAVSYFVLEKTIGEAFTDGFKDTNVYLNLREFFREQIDEKVSYIAEGIRRAFGGKRHHVTVTVVPSHEYDTARKLIVELLPRLESGEAEPRRLPSLGEVLDKPNKQ